MTSVQSILVEAFFEADCSSSPDVLDALNAAAKLVHLTIRVRYRETDSLEFIRRGIVICPATFIDGRLAFYGPMTAAELLSFIQTHISQRLNTGELK